MPNFDRHTYDPDAWGPYEPKGNVRWRHTHLLREAIELYQAQSYLIWRYREFFTTHITITPGLMGIVDHKEFASMMSRFNKELKRWLGLGNDQPRARWPRWMRSKTSQEHHWIYVLEYAYGNGIHAHELCVVPRSERNAFDSCARHWWWKEAGLAIVDDAIKIRHERPSYARHVQWFRYLIKSVDRTATVIDANGLPRTLEEIFKPETYWITAPTYAPKLCGVCRYLAPKARAIPLILGEHQVRFLSKLDHRDLDDVYDGWEVEAFDARSSRPFPALLGI